MAAAWVSGYSVILDESLGPAEPGPDVVDYAASPADVLAWDGAPAAAFADFPFT